MKLGMGLRKSIFVLGACVALSGFAGACGDDTTVPDDGGAGSGGKPAGGSGGKPAGGSGGKAAGSGGTGGKATGGKGGTGGTGGKAAGGTGGKNDVDAGPDAGN